jgi:phytoene dehydrogenase-like protein
MGKNVVVVGGGLAGLAAAVYLARAGRSVTLFERKRDLGGRAATHLRHGFRFNLGAHAFYRGGAGAAVYRELGIAIHGAAPGRRATAILGGEEFSLPVNWISLLTTSLLPFRAKVEIARTLWRIRRADPRQFAGMTVREWLDAHVSNDRAREVLEALIRLATYTDGAEIMSAAAGLAQMKVAMRGTLYIHEGWQRIVDSLHTTAVASGVNFVTSSRVVGVEHDDAVRGIEIGGLQFDADVASTMAIARPSDEEPREPEGARLPADTVLLAVDPATAADLVGEAGVAWRDARPVKVSCLDVALRSLPHPRRTFALGIDDPCYLSVHSSVAQLTPRGGALIHLARYLGNGARASGVTSHDGDDPMTTEQQLESLLDRMQPGWRDVLVHRRYLPAMAVSNALVTPALKRPEPRTGVRGLYIAGDWVGEEGMLSDAALASARAAAKAILADQ